MVAAVLKKMKRGKAPGLDGWLVEESRLLPGEILQSIAELFETVEVDGKWPAALWLLLPKAPGEGPFDRRPIWLLPILYRAWAAGRAQAFAQWRRSWRKADGDVGAEELTWELAVELESAEAADETVCGAALDWSEAFDNIGLSLVARATEQAGIPPWLGRPLLAAYSAPRRLRLDGALSCPWSPTSGILPGCLLAVFVLGILMRPWYVRTGLLHGKLRRCIYVDDLTVWQRGEPAECAEAVSDALATAHRFEQAMDF